MANTYKSKVDPWIAAIAIGPGVLVVPVMLLATREGSRFTATSILIATGVSAIAVALPLWIFATTSYEITGGTLVIRSGPMRNRIPLDQIESIVPSRSPASAPALSLDRLALGLSDGKTVLISPDDRSAFLAEL